MKKLLLILIPAAILLSCSSEKKQSGTGMGISQKQVAKLLDEKEIFNYDTVYARHGLVSKDQVTKAKQLFMQGINAYINKKDPAKAITSFLESLMYNPDYNTYDYLANAYIDMNDTTNAQKAMLLINEGMGDYQGSYTYARYSALKKDTSGAIESLGAAFSYGFTNKKRFENDKIFDYLRGQRGFVALVVTYLNNDQKLRETLFKSFLAVAPDLQIPLYFNKDSIDVIHDGHSHEPLFINYDFAVFIPGMEDSRFSRDVSNSYFMVGKIKLNNGVYAVFHEVEMVIVDTLPPVDIKMTLFDSLGNMLSTNLFAQYSLPETLLEGSIDESRNIILKESKMKWKNDPSENGYAGNEYLGTDLIKETKYTIGADGKLVTGSLKDDVVKK